MFSKKIVQTIKRPVVRITVGVLSIGILTVYAVNQGKQSYRSVHGGSVVGYQNSTTSFNSNKVEEHGSCFTVTNSCAQDVFIPTNTTGEMTSFTGNHPSCVQVKPCDCVLKNFLNGVVAGQITQSKIRNALTWYINPEWMGLYGYVLWYGQSVNIGYDTWSDPFGREKIAGWSDVATSGDATLSEFELYGVTPATENINRWCFDDGTYRVNSNVYSRQVLEINRNISWFFNGTYTNTSRYQGIIWINFGLEHLRTDPISQRFSSMRFFGCRSELLPNPDLYCVERVIPKDGTVSDSMPSAIYLKEFTNNYDFWFFQPGAVCGWLFLAWGSTFRLFSTGDIVQYDDPQASGKLWNVLMPWLSNPFMGNVLGTENNAGFLYRNTTGWLTNKYGTQMFGMYVVNGTDYQYIRNDSTLQTRYRKLFYDTGYYYYNLRIEWNNDYPWTENWYHVNPIGYNVSGATTHTRYGLVYIPLQNSRYIYLESLDKNSSDSEIYQASVWTWSDVENEAQTFGINPLQKLVCMSHTCNPWHMRYSTGCWPCSNPNLCSIDDGGGSMEY